MSKGTALFVGRLSPQDSLANYVPQNVTPAIERMLEVCPEYLPMPQPMALAPALASVQFCLLLCCSL